MGDWLRDLFGQATQGVNEHVQQQAAEGSKKALMPYFLAIGGVLLYLLVKK